jgi:HEAT repeat protein
VTTTLPRRTAVFAAALAALAASAGCGGGSGSVESRKIDELESRVAKLEARLGATPASEAALDEAALAELVQRLDAEDPLVRFAAGRALGARGEEAKGELFELLRGGTTRQREAAAAVLASSKPLPESIGDLVTAHANNPGARVRAWLDVALARTGRAEAVDPLVADLAHPATRVRLVALRGLEDLRDGRAVLPLVRAMQDPDPVVSGMARNALGAFDESVVPFLELHWSALGPRERQDVLAAIGSSPSAQVGDFIALRLSDPAPLVALEAALQLARRGSEGGRPLALERLGSADPVVARAARDVLDTLAATLPSPDEPPATTTP